MKSSFLEYFPQLLWENTEHDTVGLSADFRDKRGSSLKEMILFCFHQIFSFHWKTNTENSMSKLDEKCENCMSKYVSVGNFYYWAPTMLNTHKNSYAFRPPMYYEVYRSLQMKKLVPLELELPKLTLPEVGLGFKAIFVVTLPQQWAHWQKTNPMFPQMKIKLSLLSVRRGRRGCGEGSHQN